MPKANASTHWSNLEDFGVVWGMRLLVWVHRYIGWWLMPLFLYPVVAYYWATNKLARSSSMTYLTRLKATAPEVTVKPDAWHCMKHFLSFAHSILDRASAWTGSINHDNVAFPNRLFIEDYIRSGRGVMMIAAHLGCLEVCRALADQRNDIKLNLLVHTKNAQKMNQLLEPLNLHRQLELIEVTDVNPGTAIRLAHKIDQGEIVVVVGDRVPVTGEKNTITAKFLGHDAHFAQGPFVLAHVLKCRVLTMFCLRHAHGYQIHCEPLAERVHLPRKTRNEALQTYVESYVKRLEEHCRIAPLQWFNFYPYWKDDAN